MLTKNEKIEDFKEVTEAEKEALEKADKEFVEPDKGLTSFFERIGQNVTNITADYITKSNTLGKIKYDASTGMYKLNSLSLTEDEIKTVVGQAVINLANPSYTCGQFCAAPANLVIGLDHYASLHAVDVFKNSIVEVALFHRGYSWSDNNFAGSKLHTIYFFGAFNKDIGTTFKYAIALKEVWGYGIRKTSVNVELSYSSYLSKASLERIIANSISDCKGATITIHPYVYAKLTDETNTEWHQVLLDAAEKNITFTTV